MNVRRLHRWDVPPAEATRIQRVLRRRLGVKDYRGAIDTVAGVDVSYDKGSSTVYAGVIVIHLKDRRILETATAVSQAAFPYIPGLLSFREAPAGLKAFKRLRHRPDCLLCDGQGIAHPRRFGLACHLGLLLDLPSIGCAKSLLVGRYCEPAQHRGSSQILYDKGEQVGIILRTRDGVEPVYVSPGYRMSFDRARKVVLRANGGYRLPEPTRQAHHLVNALRRDANRSALKSHRSPRSERSVKAIARRVQKQDAGH
ncbi:MAG: deoxyribonuclease V [Candidatus Methylomirabilales bacterium]